MRYIRTLFDDWRARRAARALLDELFRAADLARSTSEELMATGAPKGILARALALEADCMKLAGRFDESREAFRAALELAQEFELRDPSVAIWCAELAGLADDAQQRELYNRRANCWADRLYSESLKRSVAWATKPAGDAAEDLIRELEGAGDGDA